MTRRTRSSCRAQAVFQPTYATERHCCDLIVHQFAVPLTAIVFLAASTSNTVAEPNQGRPKVTPNASKVCGSVNPGSHERYRLPPNRKLPQGISFATDWTNLKTGGWFGEQVMDRCRIQPDGFVTWHGKEAVRVEVQPNDDPLNLKSNTERAEMTTMQSSGGKPIMENAASGVQYYATSYYFPADWRGQQMRWSSFAPTDCSAGGGNKCNSWSFVWQFYGWGAMSAAQAAPNEPQRYTFNGSNLFGGGLVELGKWTDFVFMVDWRTGAYRVWRRHEGQHPFVEVLVGKTAIAPGTNVYIKQGLYRGGAVNGRTDVLWIGPTVRGSSFSAVERQAFGTNDGADRP